MGVGLSVYFLSLCRQNNVYCGGVGWQRDKQGL